MTFQGTHQNDHDARALFRRRPIRASERRAVQLVGWLLTGAMMVIAAPTVAVLVMAIGAGGLARGLSVIGRG